MLKWTLSSRSHSADGRQSQDRYQIKRASVRVLRRERDKENSEHLFRRWIGRSRKTSEAALTQKSTAGVRRVKVHCNPFDPRRMFASQEAAESDSGSVYMKLERLPAAVSGRTTGLRFGLQDITNSCTATAVAHPAAATSRIKCRSEPLYGQARSLSKSVPVSRGSAGNTIQEFTDKPSSAGLRRPVALKGDSPEAQVLTGGSHTSSAESFSNIPASHEPKKMVQPFVHVARGKQNVRFMSEPAINSHALNHAARAEIIYGRVKPVKKACVGVGVSGHAHTTTGQHIHPNHGARVVQHHANIQRIPQARPLTQYGRAKSESLPVIQERCENQSSCYKQPIIVQRRPPAVNPCCKPALLPRKPVTYTEPVDNRWPYNVLHGKQLSQPVNAHQHQHLQHHHPALSSLAPAMLADFAKSDGQHNTSSERGDSGISEGLTSPLSESQDTETGDTNSPSAEFHRSYPSGYTQPLKPYYSSRLGHSCTNPTVLDASTLQRNNKNSGAGPRRNSYVTPNEVVQALRAHGALNDTANSSLKRSRSFSDVSAMSAGDHMTSWSDPFAENSGRTVIENPAAAVKKPLKLVRFAADMEDEPLYQEINGSYVGNNSEALRNSQLYRSYQNIGSVFAGLVGCRGRQYPAGVGCHQSPSVRRYKRSSRPADDEETYLTMRSPPKVSRYSDSTGDKSSSCIAGGARATDDSCTSRSSGPGGRRRQESVDRLARLLEDRLPTVDSDSSESAADWSLEAVMSDTLPGTLSEMSLSELNDPRGGPRISSWCSVEEECAHQMNPPLPVRRPSVANCMVLHRSRTRISLDAVFNPTYLSPETSQENATVTDDVERSFELKAQSYQSDSSTLESWNSHRGYRGLNKPPVAAPRALSPSPTPEPIQQCYASIDTAKLSPQVDKMTTHTPHRMTVRSVKSRRKKKPCVEGSRIWRHPKIDGSHSTPHKQPRSRHLREDSNDFQRVCESGSVLGPEDTYLNALTFGRSANSSLATTAWLSLSGRKSRRVVSTQLKKPDTPRPRGQLKMRIYENSGLLTIHVIRGRGLSVRTAELCNAYVKVSLVPDPTERSFCRTRLVRHSNQPMFDERFSFEFLDDDKSKRLLVSIWHRHVRRGSELLGCMSFGVSKLVTSEIRGWFRLLNETIGRRKHFAVRAKSTAHTWQRTLDCRLVDETARCGVGHISRNSTIPTSPYRPAPPRITRRRTPPPQPDSSVYCPGRTRSAGQLAETGVRPDRRTCSDTALLSGGRTALARESGGRTALAPVHATLAQPALAPPYRLIRVGRGPHGFGLSLAWTCPPSVVSVEAGENAAVSGLRAGDYVVRIGSENVVLMDQASGLQLIQRQGAVLEMIVYRPDDVGSPSLMDVLRWT